MPKVQLPYRFTSHGGFDFSYIFTQDGVLLKPAYEERSRSGRHGEDIYELPPGTYYAVIFTRANGPNKPVRVSYRRLMVSEIGVHSEEANEEELPGPVLLRARAIYNRLIG